MKRGNTQNGEQTVTYAKKSVSGATTVLGYTDELAIGEEYVFILPEDAVGTGTGYKPAERYFYFTAEKDYSVTVDKLYDLETKNRRNITAEIIF